MLYCNALGELFCTESVELEVIVMDDACNGRVCVPEQPSATFKPHQAPPDTTSYLINTD